MKLAVTGATGLLGANLAAELLEAGHHVVATKRRSSKTSHLAELDIEWVTAPLDDVDALRRAFDGCDGVFHCAASVSVQLKIEPWLRDINVGGTARVIDAVRSAGVRRLVHCSTVGAVGLSTDGEPSDEDARWNMADFGLADAYVTTKREAEELVHAEIGEGLDAVIVNPTYMIGPYDVRPSSGKLVLELMRGKAPGYTLGKNNFVDVRDVARGMVAAMERGTTGERYILGGRNMTYRAFMDLVCEVTGAPKVERHVPTWMVRVIGLAGDVGAWLTKKEPLVSTASGRWATTDRFIFTSAKAQRALGYTVSPLEDAIASAAEWFRAQGMVP